LFRGRGRVRARARARAKMGKKRERRIDDHSCLPLLLSVDSKVMNQPSFMDTSQLYGYFSKQITSVKVPSTNLLILAASVLHIVARDIA